MGREMLTQTTQQSPTSLSSSAQCSQNKNQPRRHDTTWHPSARVSKHERRVLQVRLPGVREPSERTPVHHAVVGRPRHGEHPGGHDIVGVHGVEPRHALHSPKRPDADLEQVQKKGTIVGFCEGVGTGDDSEVCRGLTDDQRVGWEERTRVFALKRRRRKNECDYTVQCCGE